MISYIGIHIGRRFLAHSHGKSPMENSYGFPIARFLPGVFNSRQQGIHVTVIYL